MLIFHLKLWDRSARCSMSPSFGKFKWSFGSLWIFWVRIFIRSILCAQHFFSHLSWLKWKLSQMKILAVCKFTLPLLIFFSFTTERRCDRMPKRKSQVILRGMEQNKSGKVLALAKISKKKRSYKYQEMWIETYKKNEYFNVWIFKGTERSNKKAMQSTCNWSV